MALPKAKEKPADSRQRAKARTDAALLAKERVIKKAWEAPSKALVITDMTTQQLEREREILNAMVLDEKRTLGLDDFWFFFTRVLFPQVWRIYYLTGFHKPIADILQGMLSKRGSNEMFILPREHRKSFLIMLGWTVWLIVRDPNIRIMLIGAKEKTVGKWATLIRNIFVEGNQQFAEFQRVFHDFLIPPSGKTLRQALQFIHPRRTKAVADPTLFATYLGVTGAGGRADVQIFDDPYERRNVSNPIQSNKALRQTLDLFPLVEVAESAEYQLRVFNATRWAYHDPIGTLLGERHDDLEEVDEVLPPFNAMVRHAFEDPNKLCTDCPAHITKNYPHGHPNVKDGVPILYPIITREGLEKRFREYLADPERGESLWYHQYQNVCLAPSDQKFKEEWLISAHYPVFPAHYARVLAVDSADKDFQQEGSGDFMVAQFAEFDDYGRLLKVHALRSNKWTRDEFIRKIIVWCQATNWFPHRVAKEKFGGDTFLTDLGRAFETIDRIVHLLPVQRPSTSTANFMKKLDWIVESLQAPYERGEIMYGSRFPLDLLAREKYELCNLGQIKHDDMADCGALFMAKGIRHIAATKHSNFIEQGTPPVLNLYEAGRLQAPMQSEAPADPLQSALEGKRLQAILGELPTINTTPVDDLQDLVVKLDDF